MGKVNLNPACACGSIIGIRTYGPGGCVACSRCARVQG